MKRALDGCDTETALLYFNKESGKRHSRQVEETPTARSEDEKDSGQERLLLR